MIKIQVKNILKMIKNQINKLMKMIKNQINSQISTVKLDLDFSTYFNPFTTTSISIFPLLIKGMEQLMYNLNNLILNNDINLVENSVRPICK